MQIKWFATLLASFVLAILMTQNLVDYFDAYTFSDPNRYLPLFKDGMAWVVMAALWQIIVPVLMIATCVLFFVFNFGLITKLTRWL